jgi:hypothetical protein
VVWTSYSCVAGGAGWSLSYGVRLSGGHGWASYGGGATYTEQVSSSGLGAADIAMRSAHVLDTATHQPRAVTLANATTVHCPAHG